MHVCINTYIYTAISGLKHTDNNRLYSQMHVVFCSVLSRGFYNWHDMIWVQRNLEVIAQSDNRVLAVWGESQGQG